MIAAPMYKKGDPVVYYPEESRMMHLANKTGEVVRVNGSGFRHKSPPFTYVVRIGQWEFGGVRARELKHAQNSTS